MSQENVEIARAAYEAFNRRDWDAMFDAAVPDFEFTLARGPNVGTHKGREQVKAILEDQASAFEVWKAEPEEFFDKDEVVVAFVKFTLQPKGSSAEFEIRIGGLWTFRDNKALSLEGFPEREKALEAAGLQA